MPFEDEDPQEGRIVEPPAELDELARAVIGAAIGVHRELGPGLPEAAYQKAMEIECNAATSHSKHKKHSM